MGNSNGGMLEKSADMTKLTTKSTASERRNAAVFEELRRAREVQDHMMQIKGEKESRRNKGRGWDELVENLSLVWEERVGPHLETVVETAKCKPCLFNDDTENQTTMEVQDEAASPEKDASSDDEDLSHYGIAMKKIAKARKAAAANKTAG
jgi:hypothetical protein